MNWIYRLVINDKTNAIIWTRFFVLIVVKIVRLVVYVQKKPAKDLTVKYVKKDSFVENVCLNYANPGSVTNVLSVGRKIGERKTPTKQWLFPSKK